MLAKVISGFIINSGIFRSFLLYVLVSVRQGDFYKFALCFLSETLSHKDWSCQRLQSFFMRFAHAKSVRSLLRRSPPP